MKVPQPQMLGKAARVVMPIEKWWSQSEGTRKAQGNSPSPGTGTNAMALCRSDSVQ